MINTTDSEQWHFLGQKKPKHGLHMYIVCGSVYAYRSIFEHTNKHKQVQSHMYIYRQQAIYRTKSIKAQVQQSTSMTPSGCLLVW